MTEPVIRVTVMVMIMVRAKVRVRVRVRARGMVRGRFSASVEAATSQRAEGVVGSGRAYDRTC